MADIQSPKSRRLDRVLAVSDQALRGTLVVLFATVVVAALVQVAGRYLFHVTIIGPEEIARYFMIACTFLAIPVLARSRNQIAVDALAHFLPQGITQLWLARVILTFECIFLVVFALFSWEFASGLLSTGQSTVGLGMPLAWPALSMVFGAVLGFIVTAILLVKTFTPAGSVDPYGIGARDHTGTPGGES